MLYRSRQKPATFAQVVVGSDNPHPDFIEQEV
jgi:hypothetical protein